MLVCGRKQCHRLCRGTENNWVLEEAELVMTNGIMHTSEPFFCVLGVTYGQQPVLYLSSSPIRLFLHLPVPKTTQD